MPQWSMPLQAPRPLCRYCEVITLDLPEALATEPGGADIASRRLRPVARTQPIALERIRDVMVAHPRGALDSFTGSEAWTKVTSNASRRPAGISSRTFGAGARGPNRSRRSEFSTTSRLE